MLKLWQATLPAAPGAFCAGLVLPPSAVVVPQLLLRSDRERRGSALSAKARYPVELLRGLALFVLLWLGLAASAATFTAGLDRDTVTLGENATLSLTFAGGAPDSVPNLPTIPGLQITYVGPSSQFSFINGQVSSTVTHNFTVAPRQAGDFVIPAFTAEVSGEKLTTQPLKLKVLKPGAPSNEAINSGTELAFLKLALPKKEAYVGETLVVEADLYLHSSIRNLGQLQFTSLPSDGFTVGKMIRRDQRRAQVGNSVYTVIPISIVLRPIKTGALNLGPITASVVVEIASGRRRRDPIFDQLGMRDPFEMFGGEQKQLSLATDPETLQSMPLPTQNAPPTFNGAVGSYTMNFSAGPTNVAAGDPITVRVQLSGRGALDALALPDQPGWQDFKTYPPTAKVETTDPLGIQGSKTFEQLIVPQNADIKELPAPSFSFFDPEQKTYRTLTQPAVALVVKPAAAAPAPTVAIANRQTQETAPPAQDIVPIKTRLGTLAQTGPPLVLRPWFVALQSVPLLALVSAVVLRRRADRLANNPRLRRQRQVAQIVRDGLNDLRQLAAQNKSDEFFATLFRLLQEQLGEQLDLPASSITEAVIDEHLRPHEVAENVLAALQELFQVCNLARYAPVKSSQELAAIVPRLETVLGQLQSLKL